MKTEKPKKTKTDTERRHSPVNVLNTSSDDELTEAEIKKIKVEVLNPYDILGLQGNETGDEISKAYRQLAMKYSSDQFNNHRISSKEREYNEHMFQKVTHAYEMLGRGRDAQRAIQLINHILNRVSLTNLKAVVGNPWDTSTQWSISILYCTIII